LFSDEAGVYQERGLPAFEGTAARAGDRAAGSRTAISAALRTLQKNPPDSAMRIHRAGDCAQRSAHDSAVRTLMSWDIEVDEAMFLGGLDGGALPAGVEPDFASTTSWHRRRHLWLAQWTRGLWHRQSDAFFTQIGLCRRRTV
jgi:5'-nucleotidase